MEDDFVAGVHELGLGAVGEKAARMVFQKFDGNHNGKLDLHEIMGAYNSVKNLFHSMQGASAAGGAAGLF